MKSWYKLANKASFPICRYRAVRVEVSRLLELVLLAKWTSREEMLTVYDVQASLTYDVKSLTSYTTSIKAVSF